MTNLTFKELEGALPPYISPQLISSLSKVHLVPSITTHILQMYFNIISNLHLSLPAFTHTGFLPAPATAPTPARFLSLRLSHQNSMQFCVLPYMLYVLPISVIWISASSSECSAQEQVLPCKLRHQGCSFA